MGVATGNPSSAKSISVKILSLENLALYGSSYLRHLRDFADGGLQSSPIYEATSLLSCFQLVYSMVSSCRNTVSTHASAAYIKCRW